MLGLAKQGRVAVAVGFAGTAVIAGLLLRAEDAWISGRLAWIALTEETVSRVLGNSAIADVVRPRDLATGLVGLYLGLELITQLRGDRRPVDALFESVGGLLSAVTALRSGSPSRVR